MLYSLLPSAPAKRQLACAECLGQIGAIDPSRLQDKRVTTYQQDMNKEILKPAIFAAHLISHCLLKSYIVKHRRPRLCSIFNSRGFENNGKRACDSD